MRLKSALRSGRLQSAESKTKRKPLKSADTMANVLRAALSANLSILFMTDDKHIVPGVPAEIGKDYIRFEMSDPAGTQLLPLSRINTVFIHGRSET